MRIISFLAAGCLLAAPAILHAQYTFNKITLAARISLTTFSSSSGNSCWGYVSPSGREYALMGLSNKVAFVEITDPTNPVWFASINHGSSQWADIKVYQNVAYVVTERSESGIQVIDMSNIDGIESRVSLIRTIDSPGRSHTITVDTASGFLYTCGSRESTGSTTCWDLTDPRNPVRVGVPSITGGTYVHEGTAFTYPAGTPYAGKQVLFASSAFDGLMIWDVTNKNNPILMSTVVYPQLGYTHQAWMSDDLRYMYLNDEFDETTYSIPTRTLVFDIQDLDNASYVTSYTNGNTSIDHNLYVRDGYVVSSNYTSGIRIWSTHNNPTAPTEVGWFDTYPADDTPVYEGTWSNYPFFPSGTIIASDINRGLFILNPAEAMTRQIPPTGYSRIRGIEVSGNLASLQADDDNRLTLRPGITFTTGQAPIEIEVTAKADSLTPLKLDILSVARASAGTIQERFELFNYSTNAFEFIDSRMLTTSDAPFTAIPMANLNRFVGPDKTVKLRLSYRATGPVFAYPWNAAIDRVAFVNRP
jgi:choice-of-anchor B domain-containing protein